jgi:hypothetical protein
MSEPLTAEQAVFALRKLVKDAESLEAENERLRAKSGRLVKHLGHLKTIAEAAPNSGIDANIVLETVVTLIDHILAGEAGK